MKRSLATGSWIPWLACSRAVSNSWPDVMPDSLQTVRWPGIIGRHPAGHKRPPTGLAGYLHELGIRDVCVCGLARDFCVKWTAEDAVDLGFSTTVLWDLTRPVDPASDSSVAAALAAAGVRIADAAEVA